MKTRLMMLLMVGLLLITGGNVLADDREFVTDQEGWEVGLSSPTWKEASFRERDRDRETERERERIRLVKSSSEKFDDTVELLERTAHTKGMSTDDINGAINALRNLVDRGAPISHALRLLETAMTMHNYSGVEMVEIARSLGDSIEKSGVAGECARITQTCIEKGFRAREVARVMSVVENALGKDVSARQLRIMTEDLLDKGSGVEGLEVAIAEVGKSVEEGYSPEESRRLVALVALEGLRAGLRGEELARRIREEVQREWGRMEGETIRERLRDRICEDVKERLRHMERSGEEHSRRGQP